MDSVLFLILLLPILNVNCDGIDENYILRTGNHPVAKDFFLLRRFKRDNSLLGNKNYMQAAVQPSVVVMTSGVPNYVNRGVPSSPYGVQGSTYGVQSSSYGVQRPSYGVNNVPAVVVNMPDDNYIAPVVNNPYYAPTRRL